MYRRIAVAAVLVLAACGGKVQGEDDNVAVRTIGTDKGDPNDPTSGHDPAPTDGQLGVSDGGTITSCGSANAAPLFADFESGNIADEFEVTEPAAFSITSASPIHGAHSLQIAADHGASLTRKLAGECAIKLSFSVRFSAETITSGLKVFELAARNHFASLVIDAGGGMRIAMSESFPASGDGADFVGDPFFTAVADKAYGVTLSIDPSAGNASVSVVDTNGTSVPGQAPSEVGFGEDALQSVTFGGAGGHTYVPSPSPRGTWLLDDVSIE